MQADSTEVVLNLLETALFEFADSGRDAAIDLVVTLETQLALCVQGKETLSDAQLRKASALLACSPLDDQPAEGSRAALHVAQLWYERSVPYEGVAAARLALAVATDGKLLNVQRRAHNMLAALLIDDGQPAIAVEHAGHSVVLAEQLGDALARAAALTNLASGLFQQGLYRETINITRRVVAEKLESPLASTVKAQAAGVLAEAALAMGEIELAAQAAKGACTSLPNVPGRSGANRLAALGVAVRAHVAAGRVDVARSYLADMEAGISIKPTMRAQINVALATAHVMLAEGKFNEAVLLLEELQQKTTAFPPLHRDHLGALIGAYQKAGRPDKALVALSQLVDQLGHAHMSRLEGHLKAADETLHTYLPGKEDAHRFVRSVQRAARATHSKVANADTAVPRKLSHDAVVERQIALERLAVSAELKEDAEGFHAFRVGRSAALLAEALGYGSVFCREMELAARLHDVGKLSVPDGLLLKPGELTKAEWTAVRAHTVQGEEIIAIADRVDFRLAHQIAGGHHENWDGTGYPRALAGARIPEAARIARVVDVYDALTHKRVYKEAWTHEDAINWIASHSGTFFDPRIAQVFLAMAGNLFDLHRGGLDHWLRTTATPSTILAERTLLNAIVENDHVS